MPEHYKPGAYKLVNSQDLQIETSNGAWELIQVMESETRNETGEHETNTGYGKEKRPAVVSHSRQPMFLITRSEEKVKEDLRRRVEELRNSLHRTKEMWGASNDTINDLKKSVEAMRKEFEYVQRELEVKQGEARGAMEAKRNLEVDIGKIREAIGSQRMKEILDVKT